MSNGVNVALIKTENSIEGTPKTLLDACRLAIVSAPAGPRCDEHVKAVIQDYLAQRFQVALLQTPGLTAFLDDFFKKVVGEK
jgi:hypothetical protein